MPNISEALDAALRARYRPHDVRSPVTTRRGFNARLNALGKVFPTQKALAAALGVNPRTLRKWKSGETGVKDKSLARVETLHNRLVVVPKTQALVRGKPVPNSVKVTGVIWWNGYRNQAKGGHRTVTLGGLKPVMARVIRVWALAGPEAAADVFQRGIAQNERLPSTDDEIGFMAEGNDCDVTFPWSD